MFIIFLIVILLLLLSDTYIIFGVMNQCSWWLKVLFLLPTLFYCIVTLKIFLLGDMRQNMLNLIFWLTLCIVLPSVIFTLVSLIGKAFGLFLHSAPFTFNTIALVISVVWLSVALFGIIEGWKKVTIENVEIRSSKIPQAFNGYRIVQLSDFHIGTYSQSPETVRRIVDMVNSLHPDLIVFTGDLVNSSSSEIDEFMNILSQMKAKDAILSVIGNHDYCLYREYKAPDTPAQELANVIRKEREIGWEVLRNRSIEITRGNDTINIIGVDNAGSRMFPDKSDLPKALKDTEKKNFKILLSHDPSHWRREVLPTTDIDLTLSGHTHAMQFKIGNWSPSKWTYSEWGGLYEEGTQKLYVSTGVGENIAFRFGAWPQIVCFCLIHNS